MSQVFQSPTAAMERALALAAQGEGAVEPNPMVGAVVVDDQGHCLGEGFHQKYGGPHAEVHALRAAGESARGATLYVTLEPCCHYGKTPPCTEAVIAAGIRHVVVAARDPFPAVAGKGVERLQAAGLTVEVGLLEQQAIALTAPFRCLVQQQRPFVIAKWAMSWDGKIAAHTGRSQWISNPESRALVHQLRGRVDGVLVGIGTALADDPQLTARPPGLRTAARIVIDSQARLPLTSRLVQTAREVPVVLVVAEQSPAEGTTAEGITSERIAALREAGVEILPVPRLASGGLDLATALHCLGQRRMTNVLVEGGGGILGGLLDAALIDEAHVFLGPLLIGGATAPGPIAGRGFDGPDVARRLEQLQVRQLGTDIYLQGRLMS